MSWDGIRHLYQGNTLDNSGRHLSEDNITNMCKVSCEYGVIHDVDNLSNHCVIYLNINKYNIPNCCNFHHVINARTAFNHLETYLKMEFRLVPVPTMHCFGKITNCNTVR